MTQGSSPTASATSFGFDSTAAEVVNGIKLSGKRAVVTGASSGIGIETARALASAGADVTLAVRDTDPGQRTAADITATTGNDSIHVRRLDLADRASVATFVSGWAGPLHLLINDAGVMGSSQLQLTPDGWEVHFATNHLGHFGLALGLRDALVDAGGARIVSLSSEAHQLSPVIFDDPQFASRGFDRWLAYGQSKPANALFAVEAGRRWADDGITANAVHPGAVSTNLARHVDPAVLADLIASSGYEFKTLEQGAATGVFVAVSAQLEGVSGRFFADCEEAPVVEPGAAGGRGFGVAAYAIDPDNAGRLWDLSLRLLGLSSAVAQAREPQRRTFAPMTKRVTVYDYVVVGAGSAGCVVAARLSEDPDVSVALVEAGGKDNAPEIRIPAAFPSLFKSGLDWDFDTDREPGLGGRRVYLPRGRMLGGSSSMNAMVYMRGNAADYDGWASGGADGWSYPDVLPYFIRSEDNELGANDYHGVGGPLHVSESRAMSPVADSFVEAAVEAGYQFNADFNGAVQTGVGRYQLTQRNGMRWSAADAFLRRALFRRNLTLFTDALAHRVVFEEGRAVAVEISSAREISLLRADREMVLCAGAYGTPHLLLLSGVGPADHLTTFGIPVVADLPVGQGLQDHLLCGINYQSSEESLITAVSPANLAKLRNAGRGPLTSNIDEAGGHIETRSGLAGPDVQLHSGPTIFADEGLGAPPVVYGTLVAVSILSPASRGSVSLRSPAPSAAPRIVHNYLQAEEDRLSIIAGLRAALDIADQPAMRRVITGPFDVPESHSDANLLAHARRTALPNITRRLHAQLAKWSTATSQCSVWKGYAW